MWRRLVIAKNQLGLKKLIRGLKSIVQKIVIYSCDRRICLYNARQLNEILHAVSHYSLLEGFRVSPLLFWCIYYILFSRLLLSGFFLSEKWPSTHHYFLYG
jgi:hypothetical protein